MLQIAERAHELEQRTGSKLALVIVDTLAACWRLRERQWRHDRSDPQLGLHQATDWGLRAARASPERARGRPERAQLFAGRFGHQSACRKGRHADPAGCHGYLEKEQRRRGRLQLQPGRSDREVGIDALVTAHQHW